MTWSLKVVQMRRVAREAAELVKVETVRASVRALAEGGLLPPAVGHVARSKAETFRHTRRIAEVISLIDFVK